MIVFKNLNTGEDVILGTNGEDAIVRGLRLLFEFGTKEERIQAISLLKHLGRVELPQESDWDHSQV